MKVDIKQLMFVDKGLRNILVWLEKKTGLEFTITSLRDRDEGLIFPYNENHEDTNYRIISNARHCFRLITIENGVK